MWIPADRLVAVIDRHPERVKHVNQAAQRRVRLLRSGVQEFVTLGSTDRLLAKLDLLDYWHIPKDEGGLADIYENGEQYGAPDNLAGVRSDRFPRKYATEAERVEARRATWRRRYARQMGRAA